MQTVACEPAVLYEEAALEGMDWIRQSAVDTPDGNLWPKNPYRGSDILWSLYHGVPGVVVAFLRTYRLTGREKYLADAKRGANAVAQRVLTEEVAGLYTGLAGQALALYFAYRETNEQRYYFAARSAVLRLVNEAKRSSTGVEWNDCTDVVAGGAGIGLALLDLAGPLELPEAVETAIRAGQRLVALARYEAETEGLSWFAKPDDADIMPNFAHGTAGVAYFLACLWSITGREGFIDSAKLGACHLLGLASRDPHFRIYLSTPSHEDSFPVGWCHGPAGTGRLFYLLHRLTGESDWHRDWLRLNEWIFQCGLPEKRPENLGNRISRCCGDAILWEYLLDLHQQTNDPRALPFAASLAERMLDRGRHRTEDSRWWEQPGWQTLPVLLPGTGLMQGVAGVVLSLLRLSQIIQNGEDRALRLPDDPFVQKSASAS